MAEESRSRSVSANLLRTVSRSGEKSPSVCRLRSSSTSGRILVVYLIAIPLGIYSATHPNSLGDQVTTLAAFILFAVPLVWAATMAIVFICGGDFFYLFPPGGVESLDFSDNWSIWQKFRDHAWHLFLPVVLLSYDGFAGLSRYMRSSMLEVLGPGLCSGRARQGSAGDES